MSIGITRRHPLGCFGEDACNKAAYIAALVVFAGFVVTGCLSLSINTLEVHSHYFFAGIALALLLLLIYIRMYGAGWDIKLAVLFCLAVLYNTILFFIPEYIWGEQMDGIMHRSLLSGIVLIALGLPAFCSALYYLLGATPSARQVSRYPLFVFPVLLVLLVYGIMSAELFIKGIPHLDWKILTSFYHYEGVTRIPGMANYILGTFTLIGLTSVISLPIGIGAGIYISEYGGRLSGFVRLCTTMLRSISVLILALGAYTLVKYSQGTVFQNLFAGFPDTNHGSFLTAAIFLSLLVIPVITRVTEEGCTSLPNTLREASVALGASDSFTLRRIILPWTLPNILTGLLLGCAEAAGSVAVILLIGGYGEYGFNLPSPDPGEAASLSPGLGEATSLSLFIFKCKYGLSPFTRLMSSYQFTAGMLLLLITMSLSAVTLVLQKKFAGRYRSV